MKKKVVIVMPAYNAEQTLEKTYHDIPQGCYDKIILVDDVSKDKTIDVAKKLGLHVICHDKNTGYGGNQKTCYTNALQEGADVIAMLHPDYQYDPKKIPELIQPILDDKADVTYGSRMLIRGMARQGGMPLWKRFGNVMLTIYMNIMLGINLTDAATGFIAYSKKVLETVSFMKNDNGFCFDEENIIRCADKKFRISEVAIPTRYERDSSSIEFKKAARYGAKLFWKILRYRLHKLGIKSKFYS